jgi:hypothetical protein
VTFESKYCYPETIEISPDTQPGRLTRRLKWKPATLTIDVDPEDADVLIDGSIVTASGRTTPIPLDPLSDGHRAVHVKVSAAGRVSEEQNVPLIANDAKRIEVHLKPAVSIKPGSP